MKYSEDEAYEMHTAYCKRVGEWFPTEMCGGIDDDVIELIRECIERSES